MPVDVFRLFRPAGEPKEDRPEKRRAQVRRAQQVYRQRKEQYARSLEEEVARLRLVETNLVHETHQLRTTIQTLSEMLAAVGISEPTPSSATLADDSSRAGTSLAALSLSPGGSSGQSPYQDWAISPGLGRGPNAAGLNAGLAGETDPHYYAAAANSVSPQSTQTDGSEGWHKGLPPAPLGGLESRHRRVPTVPAVPQQPGARLGDLDSTTVGMEFVLALENPCLGHIHGDPKTPHQPNGHALTLSAHLLYVCPSSTEPPDTKALDNARQKSPASVLERLLSLSTSLPIEGELTPVQAWNVIRSQPYFGGLEVERLRTLTKKILEAVKCHGFGAVFKESIFKQLMHDALVVGRLL